MITASGARANEEELTPRPLMQAILKFPPLRRISRPAPILAEIMYLILQLRTQNRWQADIAVCRLQWLINIVGHTDRVNKDDSRIET